MIDIHMHILPGLDDGSPNMDTSLKMLKIAADSGVTDVFATPHYIQGNYDNTPQIIKKSCNDLSEQVRKNCIPIKVHRGVELYLSANVIEKNDLSRYCLGATDYILVETSLTGFPFNTLEMLYKIVKKGYKPILAHPERYSDIIKNVNLVEDLIYRNVYMQANAASFFGLYGETVARTVWSLFQKGFVHFIASDCHCQSEEYDLAKAKEILSEQFPDYPVYLFTDNNPTKVLNNEKVEYFNPPAVVERENNTSFLGKILRLFHDH